METVDLWTRNQGNPTAGSRERGPVDRRFAGADQPGTGLAKVLERHGVTPPQPPLESFTKKDLIALVRQLLRES